MAANTSDDTLSSVESYVLKDPNQASSELSPRTPSPVMDRSMLTATPTPTRYRMPKGPESAPILGKPPRFVYYALRQEDDADFGFSALEPEEAVQPEKALAGGALGPSQYIYTTASPEAAYFFAESASGPGFANFHGRPRSLSKRVVAKIDLSGFKGELLDISSAQGCMQYELKKDSKTWEFAVDHQLVLLVGYVHPRHITKCMDLEACPLPNPQGGSLRLTSFDAFSAAMSPVVKRILARDWAGESDGQRLQLASGQITRDEKGLASDSQSRADVCWEAKHRLDEEMRKLEERKQRLMPHLELVMEREVTACHRAFENASRTGAIGATDEHSILVMKNWQCIEEFPYWAVTGCTKDSEVWLRGTQYQTRLALNGPAALENVHKIAAETNFQGAGCRHCYWTKPAEFHLLRNVGQDGPNVVWPPYFRLFCFDPTNEELDEILNTLDGTYIRDSEHPHVFPTDEVGYTFALNRLPTALEALEKTLPRSDVEDTSQVAIPQRPLYLVLVIPQGVSEMRSQTHEVAPLYVPPCSPCLGYPA